MAVRVYRNPTVPPQATIRSAAPSAPRRSQRAAAAAPADTDLMEDAQAESLIAERNARKENRADRRQLEAARRQLRERREDEAYDHDEV